MSFIESNQFLRNGSWISIPKIGAKIRDHQERLLADKLVMVDNMPKTVDNAPFPVDNFGKKTDKKGKT
jgi:hypothetical protein